MSFQTTSAQTFTFIPTAQSKPYGPYNLKLKETGTYMSLKAPSIADKTEIVGRKLVKDNVTFQWRVIPSPGSGGVEGAGEKVRLMNVASGTFAVSYGGRVSGAVQISAWANPTHEWVAAQAPGDPTARM